MEENSAALHTAYNSVQALGRGFDVNFDNRLLYCKGALGSKIVQVDEENTRDLWLNDSLVVPNVSRDIRHYQTNACRESSGVLSFDEMVEYFNRKANLSGTVPLGSFNSAFNFTGSKNIDAAGTKSLAMDGLFIPLARVLLATALVLKDDVKLAIPNSWNPLALAGFIENFGTHIITSVTIGGKDVIFVKQHLSSPLPAMDVKKYVEEIGNQRFSDAGSYTNSGPIRVKDKGVDSGLFNSQGVYPHPTSSPYLDGKEDITVILRRRGGDDLEQSHTHWERTVQSSPDVIQMTFAPITALIDDVPGKEHLTRAISLYLEYKPHLEELRYFLEFQTPRVWAPVHDRLVGLQRKEPVCPALQFSLMGQKLYVSQEQVVVGRKPVTGLRLCLEGAKDNRLSIHVQHLSSLPKIFRPFWDTHVPIGPPKWLGPEEQDSRWFEPVKWRNFSHVSTSPIESLDCFTADLSGVFVVTGAQLGVWHFGSRSVLYMKLLFSKLPGCTVRRSLWDHTPSNKMIGEDGSSSSGGKEADATGNNKLVRFVDMSEMSMGPENAPGHWLVTGGKLGVEKGKIVLRVKYSLLNY